MCFLNISSGVLLKTANNGPWIDSTIIYVSDRTQVTLNPKPDTIGEDLTLTELAHRHSIPYFRL